MRTNALFVPLFLKDAYDALGGAYLVPRLLSDSDFPYACSRRKSSSFTFSRKLGVFFKLPINFPPFHSLMFLSFLLFLLILLVGIFTIAFFRTKKLNSTLLFVESLLSFRRSLFFFCACDVANFLDDRHKMRPVEMDL